MRVGVQVRDGVVTLTGEVETKSPVLERLVAATEGVVDVVDHLSFARDDTPSPSYPEV